MVHQCDCGLAHLVQANGGRERRAWGVTVGRRRIGLLPRPVHVRGRTSNRESMSIIGHYFIRGHTSVRLMLSEPYAWPTSRNLRSVQSSFGIGDKRWPIRLTLVISKLPVPQTERTIWMKCPLAFKQPAAISMTGGRSQHSHDLAFKQVTYNLELENSPRFLIRKS
jgi:hypothetical protein